MGTTPKLNSNPMWLPPHDKYYKEVQKAQPKMNEPFSAKNKNSERIMNLHKSVPNIDGSDMSNPLSQDIFISNQPRGAQSIMNLLGPDDQNQNNEYFQQPNNNNLITPNVPREKEYRGPRDYRPKYSTQISSQDIVINQINRSISKESSTKNIIADTTYSREEISSKSQEINTPENVQNFGSNNAMLGNQITNQEERGSENRRYTQYLPDRLKSPIRNILAKSQDEGVLSVRRASLNETLSRGEKTSSLGLRPINQTTLIYSSPKGYFREPKSKLYSPVKPPTKNRVIQSKHKPSLASIARNPASSGGSNDNNEFDNNLGNSNEFLSNLKRLISDEISQTESVPRPGSRIENNVTLERYNQENEANSVQEDKSKTYL